MFSSLCSRPRGKIRVPEHASSSGKGRHDDNLRPVGRSWNCGMYPLNRCPGDSGSGYNPRITAQCKRPLRRSSVLRKCREVIDRNAPAEETGKLSCRHAGVRPAAGTRTPNLLTSPGEG